MKKLIIVANVLSISDFLRHTLEHTQRICKTKDIPVVHVGTPGNTPITTFNAVEAIFAKNPENHVILFAGESLEVFPKLAKGKKVRIIDAENLMSAVTNIAGPWLGMEGGTEDTQKMFIGAIIGLLSDK